MAKQYKAPEGHCRVRLEVRTDKGGDVKWESILESDLSIMLVKYHQKLLNKSKYRAPINPKR